MDKFYVDDDLVELVWQLAKPKPFENLSFSAALRRVLEGMSKGAKVGIRTTSVAPLRELEHMGEHTQLTDVQRPFEFND